MIAVGGMLERGHVGVGACGETTSHCLGDDWNNKKIIYNELCQGLRRPRIDEDSFCFQSRPHLDVQEVIAGK